MEEKKKLLTPLKGSIFCFIAFIIILIIALTISIISGDCAYPTTTSIMISYFSSLFLNEFILMGFVPIIDNVFIVITLSILVQSLLAGALGYILTRMKIKNTKAILIIRVTVIILVVNFFTRLYFS